MSTIRTSLLRGRGGSRLLTTALLAGLVLGSSGAPVGSASTPVGQARPITIPLVGAVDARSADVTTSPRAKSQRRFGKLRVGISTGFSIQYVTGARLDKDLARAKNLGADQLRLDISWALTQPERDVVDWSRTDNLFAEARAKGLKVLGVIGFAPEWAQRPNGSVRPGLFADFADAAARRYANQVAAWEIWNEPNQDRSWVAKPNPAAYARLVEAASQPIRRHDPKAMILMGSMAPAVDGRKELSPETFLRGIYRARIDRSSYDAVSIHPFSYPALPSGNQEWNTFHRLPDIYRILKRNGDGAKPMWLTEYGARTGTSSNSVGYQRQTKLMLSALREARKLPFVQALFFYSLRDSSSNLKEPEDNFGMLKHNGKPKPVYRALRRALRNG